MLLISCSNESSSSATNSSSSSFTTSSHTHTFASSWEHDGTYHWHKSTCGHDVVDGKAKHTFKDEVTNPTYETVGYTTHTCTVCNYSYKDNATTKLTHNYSSTWSHDEDNHWHACTDNGYENLKSNESAHNYNITIIEPTYESGGYTLHSCETCGYSYKDNETAKLNHNYSSSWSYDEAYHWHACLDSGYKDLKSDYEQHSFNEIVLEKSTCVTKGTARYECSCGHWFIDELELAEHDFQPFVSNNDATCTEDGTKYHICHVCLFKETVVDEGSATGHRWSLIDSEAATCEEDGWNKYKCDWCDETKTETVDNFGGHNYENGSCTKCGDFKYKDYLSLNVELPHEFTYYYKTTSSTIYNKCRLDKIVYELSSKDTVLDLYAKVQKTYTNSYYITDITKQLCIRYSFKNDTDNEILKSGTFIVWNATEEHVTYSARLLYASNLKFDGSTHYSLTLSDYYRY